jgi:hypothetical protein
MYLSLYSLRRKTIFILAIIVTFFKSHALDEFFSINKIEPFKIKGVNGKMYEKKDILGELGTALIFFSNHCKISQQFQQYIISSNKNLSEQGIKLSVISPNYEKAILPDELAFTDAGDSFEEMKARAAEENYNFPYLYDGEKQIITKSLKVKITPSAFLFNKFGKLTYSGRLGNHENPEGYENSEFSKAIRNLLLKDYTYTRTKVYGTSVKFKKDLNLVENVRKRYAQETVNLNYGDSRKLNFFLRQETKYPRFFYIWTIYDDQVQTRENLIGISENYKIFRKRGLKVYTICICEEKEKAKALEILKRAQLSTLNFITSANDISEFSKLRVSEGFKTTPFCRVLYGNGKFDYGSNGLIDQKILKNSFLRVLNKD